jgi:hypothetical protein
LIDGQNKAALAGGEPQQVNEWVKLAKDAFSRSTTYFDNNYRLADVPV